MQYKLIICDMDGTLLTSKHNISDYTKEVIKEINKKGITFVIATGRPYLDAKFFRDQLGLNSFLITSNGTVAHNANDEKIFEEKISSNFVNKILDFEKDIKKYHRNIYRENEWYIEYKIDGLDEFHAESGFQYQIVDLNKFKDNDITKFFYLGEEKDIEDLEKRLRKEFSNDLTVTLSSPYCLELLKKDAHKGTAIKKIAEYLGISLEETIAFGDGLNDYEMLSSVGQGFIMGNGSPRLKEKLAHCEVIETNDNDGVAKKLKELFL